MPYNPFASSTRGFAPGGIEQPQQGMVPFGGPMVNQARMPSAFVPPEQPAIAGRRPGKKGLNVRAGGDRQNRNIQTELDWLRPQNEAAAGRAGRLETRGDALLGDPTGTAGMFGDLYRTAAKGYADPAMRDFSNQIRGVAANTAARFGGNASTEEQRQVNQSGDIFSRNLTEALARLAPQQVAAGQSYTGQVLDAAGQARGQQNTQEDQIARYLEQIKNSGAKKSLLGSIAGTAAKVGISAGAKALSGGII